VSGAEAAYPWSQVKLEAILFDLDGTLLDSEKVTDQVVSELLAERGVAVDSGLADLDLNQFHGVVWEQGSVILQKRFPELAGPSLAPVLQEKFHHTLLENPPPALPGAVAAVRAAAQSVPVALVTSSNRESAEHALHELGVYHCFVTLVCAEDCTRSKPDPQGYELAAERLGVSTQGCLVFEDSQAGLSAARTAGMWTTAITRSPSDRLGSAKAPHADYAIEDFETLPDGFFKMFCKATI
jgi:HAD superfamily hydrolase (TIGR01509 family)